MTICYSARDLRLLDEKKEEMEKMWKLNCETDLSEYIPMSIEDYAPSEMNPCPVEETEEEKRDRLWKAICEASRI